MTDRRRAVLRLGCVLALVALSGCATVAVHSTVTADGTIEEYRLDVNTSRTAYGFLENAAQEEGKESVRAYFLEDVNDSQFDEVTYDEEFSGDEVHISLVLEGFEPKASSSINISRNDGNMIYVDETFYNESAEGSSGESSEIGSAIASGMAVDYYLTMPGEIVESNADSVNGKTAEWHVTGEDAFTGLRVRAVSEAPSSAFGPGFGIISALGATVVVGVLLVSRNQTHHGN